MNYDMTASEIVGLACVMFAILFLSAVAIATLIFDFDSEVKKESPNHKCWYNEISLHASLIPGGDTFFTKRATVTICIVMILILSWAWSIIQ